MFSSKIFGAMLLIAGCCIGAGMLGLPLVSLETGYVPTIVMFIISWLFMAATGLLVLEVNLRCGEGTNLMSMAEQVLGKSAKYLVAILFAFLFYCLILAYLAGTGAILEDSIYLPNFWGSTLTALIFGYVIYRGTKEVDILNRLFIAGLAIGYVLLVFLGLSSVHAENLKNNNWSLAAPVLPIMILSFGYHNLIPSLSTYLKGNVKGLRVAILLGSLIPLLIYILWEFVFLGAVPNQESSIQAIKNGAMVTELFRNGTDSKLALQAMQVFSFFAIVTSLITVALSFVDFLIDGLKTNRAMSTFLVLFPPLVFSFIYPHVFLTALNYGSAFGAVILFGILPVLMVWKGRYIDNDPIEKQLPGGKIPLIILSLFSLFIFFMQLFIEIRRL